MNESSKQTWQTLGAALIVGAISGAAWFAINTPTGQPAVATAPAAEPVPSPARGGSD